MIWSFSAQDDWPQVDWTRGRSDRLHQEWPWAAAGNDSLWLVNISHVAWILASDWSILLILTSHWSGEDPEKGPGGGGGTEPGVSGDSPWETRGVAHRRQTPPARPCGDHRWKPGHWNIHQKCQELGWEHVMNSQRNYEGVKYLILKSRQKAYLDINRGYMYVLVVLGQGKGIGIK